MKLEEGTEQNSKEACDGSSNVQQFYQQPG